MTQIEVENNTPYRRRIFLHPMQLSVKEPIPLMLAAWKLFDLGPRESAGTALGTLQPGARVASGTALDHRTVKADTKYGDLWTFGITNEMPALSGRKGVNPCQVQVLNGLDGPDAAAVSVTLYQIILRGLPRMFPQLNEAYLLGNRLSAYASKPIIGGSSALIFEPVLASSR